MSTLEIDVEDSRPVAVAFTPTQLIVDVAGRRQVATPLWRYPRLASATPETRAAVELSPFGVHWPEIDEDLSIAGMLKGAKAPGAVPPGGKA